MSDYYKRMSQEQEGNPLLKNIHELTPEIISLGTL